MSALPSPRSEWVLGKYELVTRIASGGSGSVFLAKDRRDDSEVVVKFIDAREDALNGWVREMRIALRLVHDTIVRCRTVGFDEGLGAWALVYDYANGGSLRRALVQTNNLGRKTTHEVLCDVAEALTYAHRHGVIHRDVKPENIVRGSVKGRMRWQLTDFGDARFLARDGLAETVVGSLSYMAPETFVGRTSQRSDQYALGVVGLECLRGQLHSRRALRTLPTEASVEEPMEQMLAQMLAPHPTDRFPSIEIVSCLLGAENAKTRWKVQGDSCAVYDGTSVHWWHEEAHQKSPSARFSRFVPCTGGGIGALLGHRLVHLGQKRRTVYADESPYVPLAFDSTGRGWFARGNELSWFSTQGIEATGPASEADSVTAETLLAACVDHTLAFGHAAAKKCTLARVLGDAVVSSVYSLPLPLDTIVVVDGELRMLAADDRRTVEFRIQDGELLEHARYNAPRGHVRYVDGRVSLVRFFDTTEFFRADSQVKEVSEL